MAIARVQCRFLELRRLKLKYTIYSLFATNRQVVHGQYKFDHDGG